MEKYYLDALTLLLERDFVPHLPKLIKARKDDADKAKKNLSRAFSAFVLAARFDLEPKKACSFVVDDDDDYGIDAIYYDVSGPKATLLLMQTKFRIGAELKQEDMSPFLAGVIRLVDGNFDGFNSHIQTQRPLIEEALSNCEVIQLQVAYIGGGVSQNAMRIFDDTIKSKLPTEPRLATTLAETKPDAICTYLVLEQAYPSVDARIKLKSFNKIDHPKKLVYGFIPLLELTELHNRFPLSLYARNVRQYLGEKSLVSQAIMKTLLTESADFPYLNNGITMIAKSVENRGQKDGHFVVEVKGASVVNGAQSVSTAARFLQEHPDVNLADVLVAITIVQDSNDGDFGRKVTLARNHQNPVHQNQFKAVDPKQERLRREFALFGFRYNYQSNISANNTMTNIGPEVMSLSINLMRMSPIPCILAVRDLGAFQNVNHWTYRVAFDGNHDKYLILNTIVIWQFVHLKFWNEAWAAGAGNERLTYRYGRFAAGWLLLKQVNMTASLPRLISRAELEQKLGYVVDVLRHELWTAYQEISGAHHDKMKWTPGPIRFFGNNGHVFECLKKVAGKVYGLDGDPTFESLWGDRGDNEKNQRFFSYLASKAPQIDI